MLLFAKLAQGGKDLLPVAVQANGAGGSRVKAWQVRGDRSERRLFLINKGSSAVSIDVDAPEATLEVDRLSPYDPTGTGRTLAATDMRIDGQAVAADGTWSGLQPEEVRTHGHHAQVSVGAAEAVVVTLHGHQE
jgi:hypothetical protein